MVPLAVAHHDHAVPLFNPVCLDPVDKRGQLARRRAQGRDNEILRQDRRRQYRDCQAADKDEETQGINRRGHE